MQLRYLGFDQSAAIRTYRFDVVTDRSPAVHYAITADMGLFLKYHVGIQEGPSLCAHKLTSDLETLQEGEHRLTDEDLLSYLAARAEADSRKAARRAGVRRRHLESPGVPIDTQ